MAQKAPNNKYHGCPARMDDARQFTDYRSNDYVNNVIRMSSGIVSSYDYRQYLIKNADKLMQANRQHAADTSSCSPCNGKPVMPFRRDCDVNLVNMNCRVTNPNGVGTQISYD